MPKTYTAAVIGSTGKGGYGHRLDTAFKDIDNVDLVAIADHDPEGLVPMPASGSASPVSTATTGRCLRRKSPTLSASRRAGLLNGCQ